MSHPLFDLSNRVALVSGAASGLGKAMATGFAEAGADLVLADINADGLATTARELGALGRRVLPAVCDMSQPDQIRTMFELIGRKIRPHRHRGQCGRQCAAQHPARPDARGG